MTKFRGLACKIGFNWFQTYTRRRTLQDEKQAETGKKVFPWQETTNYMIYQSNYSQTNASVCREGNILGKLT